MSGWWVASYVVVWGLLLATIAVVLLLAREFGNFHRRFPPPEGARGGADGPSIGAIAPSIEDPDWGGSDTPRALDPSARTLLVFLSAACSACERLLPGLRTIHRKEKDVRVVIGFVGHPQSIEDYVRTHALDGMRVLRGVQTAEAFDVGGAPYGILIGSDRVVRAKGLVNGLDHLESLLAADERWSGDEHDMPYGNTGEPTSKDGTDVPVRQ